MTKHERIEHPTNDQSMTEIHNRLDEIAQHLREKVPSLTDPKQQALFETTAEVLIGLERAFQHAEQKSEPAWK
jgi:hypothetical protein